MMDADAILNVLDAAGSTDPTGERVEVGSQDPVDEADFIQTEIDRWLAGIIERNWETVERQSRSPDFDFESALSQMLSGLGAADHDIAACLRTPDHPTDPNQWSAADKEALAVELRERTKPILLVANKADIAPEGNIERLREAADVVIPTSADGELALRRGVQAGLVEYDPGDEEFTVSDDVSDQQREGLEQVRTVIDEWGGTGVQQALDTVVYDVLDYLTAYPVENETKWTDSKGRMLHDAFLLPTGSTPLDLAYAVHSDIGEGYLHAVDAREGRRIGEDHELDEGDVIKIVSTAN
jgi:ribosome-binding ATPase YchF (GTP1/OBG family)